MQEMPRPPSDNTYQVAFKIPQAWVDMADAVASAMSRPGFTVTRTDVLRSSMYEGLTAMAAKETKSPKKSKR